MWLLGDAIELLSSGTPLRAAATLDGEPLMVVSAEGGYTLCDVAERTQARRFQRPASAVRTFYRMVGASGLSRAVAGHRYQALFPRGSSLEWPPVPL